MPSTKVDQDIQANAVAALAHYYQHGDHTVLSRIVLKMPNSNRRTALLEWIHRFSSLRWDKNKNSFIRQKNIQEIQDISAAKENPFWNLKIKQEQKRHTSGNKFDPDLFFTRILSDINDNIDMISIAKLEATISSLQVLHEIKRRRKAQTEIQIS